MTTDPCSTASEAEKWTAFEWLRACSLREGPGAGHAAVLLHELSRRNKERIAIEQTLDVLKDLTKAWALEVECFVDSHTVHGDPAEMDPDDRACYCEMEDILAKARAAIVTATGCTAPNPEDH